MEDNKAAAPTAAAKAPTPAPAAPADPVPAAEPTATEAGVAAWVDSHLRNSVVARNTEVWNYMAEALKALPAFIEGK